MSARARTPGKPVSPDHRLLKRTDELADALRKVLDPPADPSNAEFHQHYDPTLDAFWAIADKIVGMRANTAEGVRAKARTVQMVYRCLGEGDDGSHPARHVMGLLRDMLDDGAPVTAPDGDDAGLIALCSTYQARRQARIAAAGNPDPKDTTFDDARGEEWDAYDAVEAAPPALTDAGRAAKAAVAFAITERFFHPDGSCDLENDAQFARRVLSEVAKAAGLAVAGRADA